MRGNLVAVYDIDPAGGTTKAWQVLSGATTHETGEPGFEFLSECRWAHEAKFPVPNNRSEFPWGSLADTPTITSCYCLRLGIEAL